MSIHRMRAMPTWMLRMILRLPSWRGSWALAWLALYEREVIEVVEAEADFECGPWPCSHVEGIQ